MSRPSFWEELKRRNVLRAAALYAGASWLLVQIATQVFPFFDVPNWAVRWIVIAAILGFPPVLFFSWFYELTPQGLKRESEIASDAPLRRASQRRFDRWIIAVLGLAVVVLLANLLVLRRSERTTDAAADRSIAVLPFENLSDDKANAYFAEGIQDEILTRLAKIGSLRVISRTSTEHYASTPGNLPEIAQRLGVSNVLEGRVQKAGDRVRINVQLIRAATQEQVWAETYDRKLDDVFGVEGEVAQAIAEALDARLTGAEHTAIAQAPTHNAEAYDAYLRGLASELRVAHYLDWYQAVRYYQQAVQADPDFALAWARLSMVHSYIYLNGYDHSAQRLADMREAAERAMKLQPDLGEAWLARGYYDYRGLNDYPAAREAFEQAAQRLPNSAEATAAIAYVERRQGLWGDALAHLQAAIRSDPQNVSHWIGSAESEAALRHYAAAQTTLERALELGLGRELLLAHQAQFYLWQGDLEAAERILATLPADPADLNVAPIRAQQLWYRHRYSAVADLVRRLVASLDLKLGDQLPNLYAFMGGAYFFGGDREAARAAFAEGKQKALALRQQGIDSANLASSLAVIEAALGESKAALEEAQRGVALTGMDLWARAQARVAQAQAEALSGATEAALATLAQSVKEPGGITPGDLRYDPIWDALRSDARFQALVAAADAPLAAASQP